MLFTKQFWLSFYDVIDFGDKNNKIMSQKKQITIVLPNNMANIPVHVVRSGVCSEIIVDIQAEDEYLKAEEAEEVKYALIWKNLGYVKVMLDEIEWLEADGGILFFI